MRYQLFRSRILVSALDLTLLLAGCAGSQRGPAAVAQQYVAACEAGNPADALVLLTPDVRGFAAAMGDPCNWVPNPAEAGPSRQVAETVTDTTATVTFQWGEPVTATRHFILQEVEGEWLVLTLEKGEE